MSTARPILELRAVTKRFPGVVALADVSFAVRLGEVHALVGENGAGKSTLMAVAAGALAPDEGAVEIDGQALDQDDPAAASELGLAIVYQHPALLPDLTVTENLVLGMPRSRRPSLRRAGAWAVACLKEIGANVDPGARVADLSVTERHLVEIAKALAAKPRVLVLDEPTESLTRADIDRLFAKVAEVKAAGTAVVYISHRIPEVKRIADRVTVLRDGRTRGTFPADEVDEDDIVRLIVGRTIEAAFPDKAAPGDGGSPVLRLASFSGERFNEVTLDVAEGEIVGLAGIEGNGQEEFIRALAGLEPATGTCTVDGQETWLAHATSAQAAGIGYLPGDRQREGLFLGMTVRENGSALALRQVSSYGLLRPAEERRLVQEQLGALAVRTPTIESDIANLSGGNQQKVVFARTRLANPRLLLADEPTRGVDAGARVEMYNILRSSAEAGQGVIVRSNDALELAGLCDRVLIFSRGSVVRELTGGDVTEDNITQAALTATTLRREPHGRARVDGRMRRLLRGDYGPAAVLLFAILALAAYTTTQNDLFISERNLTSLLFLATALIFVGFGQLLVVMTAGIDLSVGPLIGLLVVITSFLLGPGSGPASVALALVALALAAGCVGLINASGFRLVRLNPIIATLVTFTMLQGASLLLRPTVAGEISPSFATSIGRTIGSVPIAFVLAVLAAVGLELALRRSVPGLEVRAVGSDEAIARRLGVRVNRSYFGAYVGCSLLTAVGALLVAASVGIGDASAGHTFTFASITAVVLAGAAVTGGRGSFIAALFGALLIQTIFNATSFLQLDDAWQWWFTGGLTLVAAAAYSTARGTPLLPARMRRGAR